MKFKKKLVFVPIIILVAGIIIWIAYRNFAPFGKVVHYQFFQRLPGVEEATNYPGGTNSYLQIPSQIIKTSISRFSLELNDNKIQSIVAKIKLKKGVREIKLGVKGKPDDNFYYVPLYHSFFQNLNWPKIEENGVTLWQKEKKYDSLINFINNVPADKNISSYYVDPYKLLIQKIGSNKETKTTINNPLRGDHVLLVRADSRPLIVKITKQDTNAYDGEDKLKIKIKKDGVSKVEKTIGDDGITDSSRLKKQPQTETITLDDIAPGIYQIDLTNESKGADLLITNIEINQPKVIFKNYLFSSGDKPVAFWTNVRKLGAQTNHQESLQTIKLDGSQNLDIKVAGKSYLFDLDLLSKEPTKKVHQLESFKNDLVLTGEGYFSLSADSFFDPDIFKSLDQDTISEVDDVDYILTTYKPPLADGNWITSEISIDPGNINLTDKTLFFSLEVPEINKYGGELEIESLEININNKGFLSKTQSVNSDKPSLIERAGKFEFNIITKVKNFFVDLFGKITFWKKPSNSQPASIPTPSPTQVPSAKPTSPPTSGPTPTATPTPIITKITIPVKVLNGGAGRGAGGAFAEILQKAGFVNATADNADKDTYKNAQISYRPEDKSIAEQITKLLSADYKTIDKKEISTSSALITVIIGEK